MLRIALPGLAGSARRCLRDGDPVRLPAAEWLLARGRRQRLPLPDWRNWLLAAAGLEGDVLQRFAAGPCARFADVAVEEAPALTWARAEPVHLLTAFDHLQLAAPVPQPLEPAESAELIDTLNRHLAGSGFRLHARPRSGWLCECPPGLEFTVTEPAAAIGRNLRDLLPAGRDAARVRSLVNELQMLLHEHPVNGRRAAAGRATVNSVWLWGAGVAGLPQGTTADLLLTDDDWLAGHWRLHGGRVRPAGELARAVGEEAANLWVAIAPPASGRTAAEDLREFEKVVFATARAALAAGGIGRISLHTGREVLEIGTGARWAIWRRRRPILEVFA
jgi:hypothetical protein